MKKQKGIQKIAQIFADNLADLCTSLGKDSRILLAVSGGVDSVVMGWLFRDYLQRHCGLVCMVAHANFGLRGSAALQDSLFVKQLSAQWGFVCYTRLFAAKQYAKRYHLSIQMACRTLRYAWFNALCQAHGGCYLATAHHQNDDLETALLQITHAHVPLGGFGMRAQRGHLIRPLLSLCRADIMHYATQRGVVWREDVSNASATYERNRLRLEVVPVLSAINPAVVQSFSHLKARWRYTHLVQQEALATFEASYVEKHKDYTQINVPSSFFLEKKAYKEALLWGYLQAYQLRLPVFISFLSALQRTVSGKRFTTPTHHVLLDRARVFLYPRAGALAHLPCPVTMQKEHTEVSFGVYTLFFRTLSLPLPSVEKSAQNDASFPCAYLSYARLVFPLVVRSRQPGDYFFPQGLGGKKKISNYMIDEKVPDCLKPHIPLLFSQGQTAWVGLHSRVDARFRPNKDDRRAYEVRMLPAD